MPRPNDVGVGVAIALVSPGGLVLLGKRKGAHGAGQWSFPGGWVDRSDESIEAACIRGVREETGLEIRTSKRLTETSQNYPDSGFRSITLFRFAGVTDAEAGQARVCEPDKCAGWFWFEIGAALRLDLFGGVAEALQNLGRRSVVTGEEMIPG